MTQNLRQIKPMLCTLVSEPFDAKGWLFEIKWDGYRAIAQKNGKQIKLYSRAGTDFLTKFPQIAQAVNAINHNVILDGEIIASDKSGQPKFEWLQNYGNNPQGALNYCVFDILWLDGKDLKQLPLIERKKILKSVLPKRSLIVYSDDVKTQGKAFFKQISKKHLEGMVAKLTSSTYQEGIRGKDWLKIKTHLRQEVVIGGFTEPRGSRKFLGSLIIGLYQQGKLMYVGHSGGGIPDELRHQLRADLNKLEISDSPFFESDPSFNTPNNHWVKPLLVCEVSFREWTQDGRMRQPAFEGMRQDKPAKSITAESPQNLPTKN